MQFTASPTQADENDVIGLSEGAAAQYTDLAAIVRFNSSGQIDARNGSNYDSDTTVNYTAGGSYQFRLVVDPTTETYSVYVTPAGGSEVLLAQNYAFRTEQASTSTLDNLGGYGTVGGVAVTNLAISSLTSGIASQEIIGPVWQNDPIASQSSDFTVNFSATPTQNDANVVLGFSDGPAAQYTDMAAIVRFNPTGQIDVRNGSNYDAGNTVNYTAGTTYAFTMMVDPTTQTYSVYVTPAGGSQITLAKDYAFRTEQASTTTLNNFTGYALTGGATVTQFSLDLPQTPASAPTALSASAASSTKVNLSWSAPGNQQGFYVMRSTDDANFSTIATVAASTTTFSDTTIASASTYYYEVEAYSAGGTSSPSNVANVTTPAPTAPTPPSNGATAPTSGLTSAAPAPAVLPDGVTTPGPSNTGPVAGTVLTPSGSITVTTPGTVLQNLAITGMVNIEASDVTMVNCTVDGGCEIGTPGAAAGPTSASDITCCIWIHPGATGAVIKNVSVTGTGPGAGYAIDNDGGNATLLDDRVYNTSGEGIRLSASTLMEGCWMYDIGWDGLGITNGSNVGYEHTADLYIYNDSDGGADIFKDNNFQTGQTTDNGLTYRPYAVFFIDTFEPGWTVNNVTITNNYIDSGASAAFYFMSQGTVNVSDNVFGPDGAIAGVYGPYVGDTINWSNNTLESTGQQLTAPVVTGTSVTSEPKPE